MRVEDVIINYIRRHGDGTAFEIAVTTGRAYGCISSIITRMHQQGDLEWTGRKRKTLTGRFAKVWQTPNRIG